MSGSLSSFPLLNLTSTPSKRYFPSLGCPEGLKQYYVNGDQVPKKV